MGAITWGGAEGTLPAAAADLYLVAADTAAVVRMITLQNDTGGDETVTVSKRAAAVDYVLFKIDLADGYSVEFPTSGSIALDTGDSIRGDDGGSAAGIDYTISYAEEAL